MKMGWMGIFLALALGFLWESPAYAYNCQDSCGSQCMHRVLGVRNVNPVCAAACQTWKHANCHDINPVASACGEIGSNAYAEAANTMFGRSVGKRRRHLTLEERTILKDMYSRRVLIGTQLHFGVPPMDRIGGGNFRINMGSAGQTYGMNVYIAQSNADATMANSGWIELLAHELKHVEQFVNRGENLKRFGRDYFEGWCNAGMSYNRIPMEREAAGIEGRAVNDYQSFFRNGGLGSDAKEFALTCIGNKTNFKVNYQAHWSDNSWTSYTVEPNSFSRHVHKYTFANERRSPKMYLRFDHELKIDGSQWKEYLINQFASSHTDCNRQNNKEEFKYKDDGKRIDLYRNY